MCLPFRISEQASAGGHCHILLPTPQPLMRATGGAGRLAQAGEEKAAGQRSVLAQHGAEPGEG